jgi:hypothetical protein
MIKPAPNMNGVGIFLAVVRRCRNTVGDSIFVPDLINTMGQTAVSFS